MAMGIKQIFGDWDMSVADYVYGLLIQAGAGNKYARGVFERIRKAAEKGDAKAVAAQEKINAVAKFVTHGLPKPSAVAARKLTKQPLRQSGDQARFEAMIAQQQQQQEKLEETIRRQQEAMKRQREQLQAQRKQASPVANAEEQPADVETGAEEHVEEDAATMPGANYGDKVNVPSPAPGPDMDGEAAPGDVEFSREVE